jgi:hypothetical protein
VNVPLAGPVSFVGFIIIGPAVLVVLRVYLQIYIEHGKRLARVARLVPAKRDPTLLSSQNAFLRIAFASALFLLLPLTLLMFVWKAAVFPAWGAGLLCVAAAVIASHVTLPLHRLTWRARMLLSVGVAILAGGTLLGFGLPRRSFELFRANLSGQWLVIDDLRGAHLNNAKLSGADLGSAYVSSTDLGDVTGMSDADLHDANLRNATLDGANLFNAKLNRADLGGAHLRNAKPGRRRPERRLAERCRPA